MSRRPDGPRILLYAHNGVGIGHVYRQLTLGRAIRNRHPDADVLVVTGSHAAGTLAWPEGVEYLKLPSIRMVDRYENWVPRNLSLSMRKVTKLRSGLIREAVRRFVPDLLVADFIPTGPYGELLPALEELERRGGRAVAGFRDIIDEPKFVRELWKRNGTYAILRDHYDSVCVYGARDVADFDRDYGLGRSSIHYVGYLAPPVHEEEGTDSRPFILATTGGGVDGRDLLCKFLEAAGAYDGRRLIVAGPLLSAREYKDLRSAARATGVEVERAIPDLARLVHRADVVVTMAGYNTSCALLNGTARAVIAPRNGPSQEQHLRARWLERWGVGEVVSSDPAPTELAASIERVLEAPQSPPAPIPLDGITRAVELFVQIAAR